MDIEKYNKFVKNIFAKSWRTFDIYDKESNAMQHILYMLARTQSMFRWEGLPDTIPARMVELYLQTNGYCAIAEHNGNLYAFAGGLGGEPDAYYMPTIFTVANPGLNFSANLKIGEDCEVINNDSLYIGLLPLYARYASQMVETELSINRAIINTRIIDLITATDDTTRKSAEKFLEDIEKGKLGVIGSSEFFEGVKALPYMSGAAHGIITDLIETEQYMKASWYNEIGLNANYNMKRESLNSSESQMNNDALLPLVDDMLTQRQNAVEKVNQMFGLNVSVTLDSSWEDNAQEVELEHAAIGGNEEVPENV